MAHAPVNEAGVVALFCMVARDLGYYIQEIGTEFPDCIVRRDNGRGWEELAVEFEWDSRSFRTTDTIPAGCDAIVCWHHNWVDCPADIEVIRPSRRDQETAKHPDHSIRSAVLTGTQGSYKA